MLQHTAILDDQTGRARFATHALAMPKNGQTRWFSTLLVASALCGLTATMVLADSDGASPANEAAPAASSESAVADEVAALIGDPALGEKVFKKCKACHEAGPDAKNKVGPRLTNVIGRPAGSIEDFKYGNGMVAAAELNLIWTPANIVEYIQDPRGYLRALTGNPKAKAKMTFKLKKEDDRNNVVAYLNSLQ